MIYSRSSNIYQCTWVSYPVMSLERYRLQLNILATGELIIYTLRRLGSFTGRTGNKERAKLESLPSEGEPRKPLDQYQSLALKSKNKIVAGVFGSNKSYKTYVGKQTTLWPFLVPRGKDMVITNTTA